MGDSFSFFVSFLENLICNLKSVSVPKNIKFCQLKFSVAPFTSSKIFSDFLLLRSPLTNTLVRLCSNGRLNLESVTIAPHHLFAHENAPHFSPFILYDMFSSQLKKKIISGNSSCVYFDNRK